MAQSDMTRWVARRCLQPREKRWRLDALAGVALPEAEICEKLVVFSKKMGDVTSSTEQDVARKKHTEVDSLNGYVVSRGAEVGVPTPLNHMLTALLKLIEAKF